MARNNKNKKKYGKVENNFNHVGIPVVYIN